MHTLIKTYKFKLYQSRRNRYLDRFLELSCEIWNRCIALHRRYYKMFKKYPSENRIKKLITKMKRTKRFAHWNQLNSQAIQDVVERIDRSYQVFFDHLRKKRKGKKSPPHFKKRTKYASFTLKQSGYKLDEANGCTYIMGRKYRYHKSREITGVICTITVKRNRLGEYFIYIVTKQEVPDVIARAGKAVGMDFGLKHFLTLYDGRVIDSPQFLKATLKELKSAHRALSKCQNGSNNWERARLHLDRMYENVSNCRRDWFFKLAHELVAEFAVICIEDLNIEAMKRLWGRKVSDLAFAEFVSILYSVSSEVGTTVVEISRWNPTSKQCHVCGHVNKELSLKEREWTCPSCHTKMDRDVNAAINIKQAGLTRLAETA